MEVKATIHLNTTEIDLLMQAAIVLSKANSKKGNYHKSGEFVDLADKLATAKEDLYWRQGVMNEEKPTLDK